MLHTQYLIPEETERQKINDWKVVFMYLRAILCTFQISVDFYYVPVGWRGEAGEGGGLERGG
jgi:hypothetical protein